MFLRRLHSFLFGVALALSLAGAVSLVVGGLSARPAIYEFGFVLYLSLGVVAAADLVAGVVLRIRGVKGKQAKRKS